MNTQRLLLPFTHNIQLDALEYAVLLAKSRNAILVPVSLLCIEDKKAVRLEHIQQSKDFLGAVAHKAVKHDVGVEQEEVVTCDIVTGMQQVVEKTACSDGIFFIQEGRDILLSPSEIQLLAMEMVGTHHVIALQKAIPVNTLPWYKRLSGIWSRHTHSREAVGRVSVS